MTRKRRKVNLTDISDPRGITLTKSPANLSGFKIVRSNNSVQKRGDLRAIVLPEDADPEFAARVMSAYDLGDDFSVHKTDSYTYLAVSGFSDDEVVVPVNIGFGLTALIDQEALSKALPRSPVSRSDNEIDCKNDDKVARAKKHPELSALHFASDSFADAKAVGAWVSANSIDTDTTTVAKTKGNFCSLRFCDAEDTHTVDLGDGVSAEVFGKAGGELPHSIYRSILHKTYGYNDMWESVDFATLAANPAYIDSNETSIEVLASVLQNIMLHSDLSVDSKKAAVSAAVTSYESYTLNLLNSLPEPSFSIDRNINPSSTETDSMSKNVTEPKKADAEEQKEITRSAEVSEPVEAEQDSEKTITVSREDLKTLIRDCLISVKQDNEAKADEAPAEEPAQRSDPMETISAAIQKMAETNEALAQRMASVEAAMGEQDDSVTVARSAEDDTEQQPEAPSSLFKGVFG